MIGIRIEPGENPASAKDIRLMAGDEQISNVRIIKALNEGGRKTVLCEIIQEKKIGHKDAKAEEVRLKGRRKSGLTGEEESPG